MVAALIIIFDLNNCRASEDSNQRDQYSAIFRSVNAKLSFAETKKP